LTSVNSLVEFEQIILNKKGEIPKYFEMLIKVSGYIDHGLETEIMHFFELTSDFVLIKE
jgi:hypothetical protein